MRQSALMVAIVLIITACTNTVTNHTPDPVAPAAIVPADVSGPQSWGASQNVTHLKYLYFSSQPNEETLRIAKSNGVTTIINLRNPSEYNWDEEQAVKSLGLNYINIPIERDTDTFDQNAITSISAAVKAQHGEPVLIHCSTSNRAAAWLAIHLIGDHGMDQAESLNVASKAGLNSDSLIDKVRKYTSK